MNNVKICILTAVYNTEKYLPKYFQSLQRQSYKNFEVLLIDDASTDQSLEILRAMERQDPRFHVLALEHNQGQAHARNVGLSHATGDFVTFLDSDDWYSADALRQAVKTFEQYPQTDCVLFDLKKVDEQTGEVTNYPMTPFTKMTGKQAFIKSLTWEIHGVYMARMSLQKEYPYDETCRSYSDDNTTRLHFLHSREVRCCSGSYFYLQRATSVTHDFSIRHFDQLRANENMKRLLEKEKVESQYLKRYENVRWLVVVDQFKFYLDSTGKLSDDERGQGLREIQRIWQTIDTKKLYARNKHKLGYYPFHCSWTLFCWQERLYFALKKLFHRY